MNKFLKLHWFIYCLFIFALSRVLMFYAFTVASSILHHHHDFFTAMCHFDCKWYLTIIDSGYDLHRRLNPGLWYNLANWAFFPLYPYTIKFLVGLTDLPVLMLGVLFNQAAIFLALIIFYHYLNLFVDEHNSRFGVALVAFSPFSIYFASLYTEALFFLLSLSAFYAMHKNRPYIAALCGALLAATRPVGIMFSIVFFLYQMLELIHHDAQFRRFIKIISLSILATSGLFIYMFYLKMHVGDSLAFLHIEHSWGRDGFNLHHLRHQLWHMISDTHNFMLFSLSLALSIYLIVNGYLSEGLFNLLCIFPGAVTGTMLSEGRFVGTLFTFYFALVILARKSSSLKFAVIMLFMVLFLSYFLYWIAAYSANFLI